MKKPFYITEKNYSRRNGAAIEGTVPVLRNNEAFDIVFVSLGMPQDELEKRVKEIGKLLNAGEHA